MDESALDMFNPTDWAVSLSTSPPYRRRAADTFPEFMDPERARIIRRLPTWAWCKGRALWACLWLSDIDRLWHIFNITEKCVYEEHLLRAKLVGAIFNNSSIATVLKSWTPQISDELEENDEDREYGSDAGEARQRNLDDTQLESLFEALEIDERAYRGALAEELCLERDNGTCLVKRVPWVTGTTSIFPSYFRQPKNTQKLLDLWDTLSLFWEKEKIEAWQKAIQGPDGVETCGNMMCLGLGVATYWQTAAFALKPIDISEDRKALRVEFHWLPQSIPELVKLAAPPIIPTGLNYSSGPFNLWDGGNSRRIQSGDVLTFRTADPERIPLPSINLLHMQWVMNRLIAISGILDSQD